MPRWLSRSFPSLAVLIAVHAGGCGGDVDDRPAKWGYISPAIIQPNCATSSCHNHGAAVAGLDFATIDDGWNSLLTTRSAPVTDSRNILRGLVLPFNPAQSRVVHMLRADGARRMPPDRPLPEADIALIWQWILNGATK